jgi:hypothetical protein
MSLGKERATEGEPRHGMAPMLRALNDLRKLNPPCWKHHTARATTVIEVGDELHAVCGSCAELVRQDRRVQRQRDERNAMRRRAI